MTIIRDLFLKKVLIPRLNHIKKVEDNLAKRDDQIQAIDDAAIRFNHPERMMQNVLDGKMRLDRMVTPKLAPLFLSSMLGVLKANKSINKNPKNPRTEITPDELDELNTYAHKLNCVMGFAKLDHLYIFKGKSISFDNSIVLAMEMKAEPISTAPSPEANYEVQKIYKDLGDASNKIASWLRKKGFACHAVPARNGLTLHPPMAVRAGLGYYGYHGLCITEEYGPRIRLATVHTNITNLPFYEGDDHEWIEDYCQKCQLCAKACPGDAFYDKPIHHNNGLVTHIDQEKCFPYFAENHGCAVCVSVCPFSKVDYKVLKINSAK